MKKTFILIVAAVAFAALVQCGLPLLPKAGLLCRCAAADAPAVGDDDMVQVSGAASPRVAYQSVEKGLLTRMVI